MPRFAGSLLFAALLPGCGPEVVEEAELADVCGEPSPFRILELDEHEQLIFTAFAVRSIGDRMYFVTGPVVGPDDEPQNPFSSIALPPTTTVWSTGVCGESPRVIAHDVWRVFEHERWPGLVMACQGIGYYEEMVLLDPLGNDPPRTVFPAPGCGISDETDHGIVGPLDYDAPVTSLVLLPWPENPGTDVVAPVVLLADMSTERRWAISRAVETEVFAVDADDRLWRVTLPDGQPQIERENVADFDVSSDGRYLVWKDATPTGGDPDVPSGVITLHDRTTGAENFVIDGHFQSWPQLGDDYLFVLDMTRETLVIVHVPTLTTFEMPWDANWIGPLADDRWMRMESMSGPFHLVDLASGGETLVTERRGAWSIGQEEMWLIEGVSGGLSSGKQGKYWHIPYDGSGEQLLAHRVTPGRIRLEDGRIVTPLDVDDRWLADLVVVEPDTLAEKRIDERVFAFVSQHTFYGGYSDGTDLLYGVTDGERSGVWLARLPPHDGASERAAPLHLQPSPLAVRPEVQRGHRSDAAKWHGPSYHSKWPSLTQVSMSSSRVQSITQPPCSP